MSKITEIKYTRHLSERIIYSKCPRKTLVGLAVVGLKVKLFRAALDTIVKRLNLSNHFVRAKHALIIMTIRRDSSYDRNHRMVESS